MEAQQKTSTVIGEYYLRGIMETASGFKLNPDHSFDFFFSYGALDRAGKGGWEQKGELVILNSEQGQEKSFALINSKTVPGDKVIIKIADANPSLRSHVYAFVKSGDKALEEMTDSKGEISFPKMNVDSILLILEFCPEKTFVFTNTNAANNYFEFRFEKDIMEVFFNQLVLKLTDDGMEGQHPLLKEGIYQFQKN